MPRIIASTYHDILTEEIMTIAKKCKKIDFISLKKHITMESKRIFLEMLNKEE
jgi:hypothetical protein